MTRNRVRVCSQPGCPRLTSGPHADQGFRVVRVAFTFPDDAGLAADANIASYNYVELLAGDVTDELSLADLEALAA